MWFFLIFLKSSFFPTLHPTNVVPFLLHLRFCFCLSLSICNIYLFYLYLLMLLLCKASVLWHCWLGGRKGIRPVKNFSGGVLAWLSLWSEMQAWIWPSWCHCHSLSLASVKCRLFLPFCYRLTRVVPEKGPLNGCVYVAVVCCVRFGFCLSLHLCRSYLLIYLLVSCCVRVKGHISEIAGVSLMESWFCVIGSPPLYRSASFTSSQQHCDMAKVTAM